MIVRVREREFFFRKTAVGIAEAQSAFTTVATAFFLGSYDFGSVEIQVVVYARKQRNVVVAVKEHGGEFPL